MVNSIHRVCLLLGMFFLFPPLNIHASESSYEKHIARGIAALEAGTYGEAAAQFRAALAENPDDGKAALYLGIALSRSGDAGAESQLRKALRLKPDDPRTNLELGIHYFSRSMYDEADDYFENTARLAPGTALADKAGEYRQAISKGIRGRRWALNMTAGMQYDSNVVLNPSGGPLPQEISGKADWRAVVRAGGRYAFLKTASIEGYAGYNLYQSLHSRLSDFNISRHLFDIGMGYRGSPVVDLKAVYEFEYIFVGGDGYDSSHTLAPSLVIHEGKDFVTEIEYRLRRNRFMNPGIFIDNSDRTGTNNLMGIAQVVPLGGSAVLRVGYSHDVDSTRQQFWDYRGDKIAAALRLLLGGMLHADFGGEYYSRNYKGTQPGGAEKRRDRTFTASVSLTKRLSERFSLTVGQLYSKNSSNLAAFDYNRSITSVFLNARF